MSYPTIRKYTWPLSVDPFTFWDRLRLAWFTLNKKNRLTQAEQVRRYEEAVANYIGCKFSVYVTSGSTANTLLAMYVRDHTKKRLVALPAVTWQTSCSPWIREGFTPQFFDVHIHDFSLNLSQLDHWLDKHASETACVFVTSLLGFSPDLEKLQHLQRKHQVTIYLDNCEAALTEFQNANISAKFTSTISTYFAHHIQSVEGGFVLTNDEDVYTYCLMARNHGMVRSLKSLTFPVTEPIEKHRSKNGVPEDFDFSIMGNNFRNTEINALLGQMDLLRVDRYTQERRNQYQAFHNTIDIHYVHLPSLDRAGCFDVPFCLPVVPVNPTKRELCLRVADRLGIETRPIVGGNLLKHRAYQEFYPVYYPTADLTKLDTNSPRLSVADRLHLHGFYVGIGSPTTVEKVREFAVELNKVLTV